MEDHNKPKEDERKNVKAMKIVGIIVLAIFVIYLLLMFTGFISN